VIVIPTETALCSCSARTAAPAVNQRQMHQSMQAARPAATRPAAQPARNQNAGGGDSGRVDELALQVTGGLALSCVIFSQFVVD